jgi:peptidoglycan/xylan/chitin deacetylase (PgdA/CDA1 family)
MEYLLKHNYEVVSLERAVGMMKEGKDIPKNWVALTFDDGYKDFYSNVYPIITERRFNATLFVYTDKIEKDEDSLTWRQIGKLGQDSLVTIGSHSLSHEPLVSLPPQLAKKEINESKLMLEKKLGRAVNFFAYPYGALDGPIRQMVRESGYEAAVGTAYRRGKFKDNDIYVLRRVFVSKASRFPFMFRFMVSGYYVPAREWVLMVLNIKTPRDVYK